MEDWTILHTILLAGLITLALAAYIAVLEWKSSREDKIREARLRWMLLQDRLDEREFRREGRQMWREIRAEQRDSNVLLRMLRERQDGGQGSGEAGAT